VSFFLLRRKHRPKTKEEIQLSPPGRQGKNMMLLDSDVAKEMHDGILAMRAQYRICSQRLERLRGLSEPGAAAQKSTRGESDSEEPLREVRSLICGPFSRQQGWRVRCQRFASLEES
jgi:hypothetical protein